MKEKPTMVQSVILRPLADLHPNPKNPRRQGPDGIEKLAESIRENPAFFEARPILLSNRTGELVIIGGERRSEAARFLGMTEVPTILIEGLTEEQEDEIMVRDNTHSGVWDGVKLKEIATKWGADKVKDWNPNLSWAITKEDSQIGGGRKLAVSTIITGDGELDSGRFSDNIGRVIYEPKETKHKIADLYSFDAQKFDEVLSSIENEELKEMLRLRAAWFVNFNFDKIADYYAYQASPNEKKAFEALGLVLLDYGQMIENGFAKLVNDFSDEKNHE